jgi:hypothetical protein
VKHSGWQCTFAAIAAVAAAPEKTFLSEELEQSVTQALATTVKHRLVSPRPAPLSGAVNYQAL